MEQNKWIKPEGSEYETPAEEYIYSPEPGISLRALAEKWQAKKNNLANWSRNEKWVEQRAQHLAEVKRQLSHKITSSQINEREKFLKTYQGLWTGISKGIQQKIFYKDANGEFKIKDYEPSEWNQICQALAKAQGQAAQLAGIDLAKLTEEIKAPMTIEVVVVKPKHDIECE